MSARFEEAADAVRSGVVARARVGALELCGIGLLVAWTAAQIAPFLSLNGYADLLYAVKLVAGPIACVATLALAIRRVQVHAAFRGMLAYTVYAAAIAVCGPEPLLAGLYLGWGAMLFVAIPAALRAPRHLHLYVKWNTVVGVAMLCIVAVSMYLGGESLQWTGGDEERSRLSLRMNPGYLGKISAGLLVSSFLLFRSSRRLPGRLAWVCVMAGTAYVTILTDSRTMVLSTLTFGVALAWQSRHGFVRYSVRIAVLVVLVGGVLLASRSTVDAKSVDSLLSGRLSIWTALAQYNLQHSDYSVLKGNGSTLWPNAWDNESSTDLAQVGLPTNRHVDNMYLDVLFSSGAVGLTLLAVGFACWLRRPRRTELGDRGVPIRNAVVVSVLAAGLTDSILPSLGNVTNSIVLPLAIGLTLHRWPPAARGRDAAQRLQEAT